MLSVPADPGNYPAFPKTARSLPIDTSMITLALPRQHLPMLWTGRYARRSAGPVDRGFGSRRIIPRHPSGGTRASRAEADDGWNRPETEECRL